MPENCRFGPPIDDEPEAHDKIAVAFEGKLQKQEIASLEQTRSLQQVFAGHVTAMAWVWLGFVMAFLTALGLDLTDLDTSVILATLGLTATMLAVGL